MPANESPFERYMSERILSFAYLMCPSVSGPKALKTCLRFEVLVVQLQYKYELFHINFTSFHYTGRYELNKLSSLPMCSFIAQLVEHRTGIRGGHEFQSRRSPDFSSTSAVRIWIISYIVHVISLLKGDMNSENWPQSQCVASYIAQFWVGRTLHRYSRRSRIPTPLKPWFFQTSSFQLLKLDN